MLTLLVLVVAAAVSWSVGALALPDHDPSGGWISFSYSTFGLILGFLQLIAAAGYTWGSTRRARRELAPWPLAGLFGLHVAIAALMLATTGGQPVDARTATWLATGLEVALFGLGLWVTRGVRLGPRGARVLRYAVGAPLAVLAGSAILILVLGFVVQLVVS